LYRPENILGFMETDTAQGDVDAALAAAPVARDHTYTTPAEHHNPMEPHAALAIWHGDALTVYDSNQGAAVTREAIAQAFRLPLERVRVIAPYVGGGFGGKAPHPYLFVAIMASQTVGRPAKLALTRQQLFALAGYRSPTIQRIQLGAERDGRLVAIAHDV